MIYDCQLTRPEPSEAALNNPQSTIIYVQLRRTTVACLVGLSRGRKPHAVHGREGRRPSRPRLAIPDVRGHRRGAWRRSARFAGVGISRRRFVARRTNRRSSRCWIARPTRPRRSARSISLAARKSALVGENTEGKSVVQAIRAAARSGRQTRRVAGAGKIARAVAVELAPPAWPVSKSSIARKAGPASWRVCFRESSPCRSRRRLAGRLSRAAGSRVLIHATSIEQGASDAPLPLAVESLRSELFVADVTANTPRTWLLGEAKVAAARRSTA